MVTIKEDRSWRVCGWTILSGIDIYCGEERTNMDVTKTSCKRDLYCVSCDLGKGVEYHPLLCRKCGWFLILRKKETWTGSFTSKDMDLTGN